MKVGSSENHQSVKVQIPNSRNFSGKLSGSVSPPPLPRDYQKYSKLAALAISSVLAIISVPGGQRELRHP